MALGSHLPTPPKLVCAMRRGKVSSSDPLSFVSAAAANSASGIESSGQPIKESPRPSRGGTRSARSNAARPTYPSVAQAKVRRTIGGLALLSASRGRRPWSGLPESRNGDGRGMAWSFCHRSTVAVVGGAEAKVLLFTFQCWSGVGEGCSFGAAAPWRSTKLVQAATGLVQFDRAQHGSTLVLVRLA